MYSAYVVISLLLAALLTWSAARKLSHSEAVVASYAQAGVPKDKLTTLAILLLAAATGLVSGIFLPLVGIAASAALVIYFAAAVSFHVRAGDTAHIAIPVALCLLAVTALALRIVSS